MSLKSVETPEKNVAVLEISVDAQTFEDACQKAYKKNVGKIALHGFRKGKAPRKMIEKVYGSDVFYEDAVSLTYPDAYDSAVAESGIEPIDRPELNIKEIGPEGYTFTAKVFVKPEIKVGKYAGIEAVMPSAEVSDAEVDAEIARRRERSGRLVSTEREIAEGDTAVIDFEGFVDGVAFEGGKGEKYNLKIGSHQFIPGFEEQLVGKKAGEAADVTVTFPAEYHAEELAGKEAVFKVLIHEVKENILPELDDEFAKDVSEFDTFAEYRADVAAKLKTSKTKNAEDGFEGEIIDKMLETIEGEIPSVMFEKQLDRITEDYSYRMQSQGITLENYLKMSGMDLDSFRKTFMPQAERQVKTRLALEAVAKAEGFAVSDEEIEAEYAKLAEQYQMEIDKLRDMLPAESMREDLLIQRSVEFVKANAVQVEAKTEESAPAAE